MTLKFKPKTSSATVHSSCYSLYISLSIRGKVYYKVTLMPREDYWELILLIYVFHMSVNIAQCWYFPYIYI